MESKKKTLKDYNKFVGKRITFLIILGIALLISSIIAVSLGSVRIPALDVLKNLFGQGKEPWNVIIWNIRLPRIITAIVAGMGLAVSGAVMQSILRNPIGSPFTLGTTHAAAFGAAFAIVILGAGSHQSAFSDAVYINNPYIITISAFIFSLISTGVIIFLAKYKGASPETMILTGVAMGSLFIAGTTAIEYFSDDVQLSSIIFWTFGDVGRTSWNELIIISIVILPAMAYFIYNSWNYNAMDAGEETAKSLGVKVESVRIIGLLIASLVTALIVSFVGIIGFIGLVVPHMIRKAIGGDQRFVMVGSILGGALLLLVSDTVARLILAPIVLPVGILTSFLGAPLFIFLVIKGRDYW